MGAGMNNLWNSGHVNRWHNHPNHALRNSRDTVWQHAARCAVLTWQIWPDIDAHSLVTVLLHDAAESVTGDTPGPAKRDPDLSDALSSLSKRFNYRNDIPEPQCAIAAEELQLVDKLDAYLWARSVDPAIVQSREWRDQLVTILDLADSLHATDKVKAILDEH